MKRPLLLAPLLLLSTAQSLSTRVKVPNTNVSFELPSGFVPMPADILKLKYSRGTPPAQVYSTPGPSWAVNIAFDRRNVKLPSGGLAELQKALESSITGASGFRWEKHGIQKLNGRDWIVLQFWVDGLDTPIYNDLRATPDQGGLLLVTANVTKALYPQYAKSLKAALDSLG